MSALTKFRANLSALRAGGAITPAPTPEEAAWWREASKPERRRSLRLWIPYYTGMFVLTQALRHPAAFFGGKWMFEVPLGLTVATASALLYWRLISRTHFRLKLQSKRLRDAVLAEDGGTHSPA